MRILDPAPLYMLIVSCSLSPHIRVTLFNFPSRYSSLSPTILTQPNHPSVFAFLSARPETFRAEGQATRAGREPQGSLSPGLTRAALDVLTC